MNLLDDVQPYRQEFEVTTRGQTEICHAGVCVYGPIDEGNIPDCDDPDRPWPPYAELAWMKRDGNIFCLASTRHSVREIKS